VGQVQRLLVDSPAYLQRKGAPQLPSDLPAHDIMLGTTIRPLAEWRFRRHGRESTVRFTPRLQLNDVEAMLNMARSGFGLARFMSYQVADDLREGRLVRLLQEWEPDPVPVQLVVPSARHVPARLRAFIDFAVDDMARLDVIR